MSAENIPHPTDASIILTYRCPMKCKMCNIWFNPTKKDDEIKAADLRTLPRLKFINLTGGEPFVREDLAEIVEECYKHTDRIVISTSGWFEDKVVALAKQFPNIGIRISIEGLSCKNDELRGHAGGFDKGLRTLLTLKQMGLKDIGFGCTVSNNNSKDMLSLYQLSLSLGMEFATAAFHNSYYFHKDDNVITNKDEVCKNFEQLIEWQLQENHPKSWFRAWFNMGLINYIEGGRRMLPVRSGFGELLHRSFRRGVSVQRSRREILAEIDGQYPRNARLHGYLGERPGAGSPRHGPEMPEKLLDGRYGQSCNAQIHEIPAEVGAQKQAPQPAGKTGLSGQEVVRCRPRPDAGRFAGKILTKS